MNFEMDQGRGNSSTREAGRLLPSRGSLEAGCAADIIQEMEE